MTAICNEATMQRAAVRLCGRMTVDVDGHDAGAALPRRQGRWLFAYLLLNRTRPVSRDELIDALWPYGAPPAADSTLSAVLSRLRTALHGWGSLEGRVTVSLVLAPDSRVDVEEARAAVATAARALADGFPLEAAGPARAAAAIARRPVLPGDDTPWLDELRRELEELRVRALDMVAEAALSTPRVALAEASAAADELIRVAPLRERGYALAMRAAQAQGDFAQALRRYDDLRRTLSAELGTHPSPALRALHAEVLAAAEPVTPPAGASALPGADIALDGDASLLWLAEVASNLCNRDLAHAVYERLLPRAGAPPEPGALPLLGAVDRALGVLEALLDRLDQAEARFAAAVALCEDNGSEEWAAWARCDWAAALLAAGGDGRRQRAHELLDRTTSSAVVLGLPALAARAAALRADEVAR